ncbi:MAG: hypothetical protein M3Q07_11980 [Pseudobdellovibrionaceae bacterium]|nr:hypothetical protein [Pseudobdellovibrionaceae bacterium]
MGFKHDFLADVLCFSGGRVKAIRNQTSKIKLTERVQTRPGNIDPHVREALKATGQRMQAINFIVTIGPNEKKPSTLTALKYILNEAERAAIGPLKIINEYHQRVIILNYGADNGVQGETETAGIADAAEILQFRQLTQDRSESGDQVDSNPGIMPEGPEQSFANPGQLSFGKGQEVIRQRREGTDKGFIRYIAAVLIELAFDE